MKGVSVPPHCPYTLGLGQLLSESSEEALHLVLEAMLVVVKADPAAAVQWQGALAPAALRIWSEHVTDPLLSVWTHAKDVQAM